MSIQSISAVDGGSHPTQDSCGHSVAALCGAPLQVPDNLALYRSKSTANLLQNDSLLFRTALTRRPEINGVRPTATLWEAVIVLGLPVIVFLGRQIWRLVDGGVLQFRSTFTDSRVLSTLALEVGMAVLLVLVHWNQGVLALVSVLPFAVLLTGYFVLTRRLWPIVVNNAIGLGACVGGDS